MSRFIPCALLAISVSAIALAQTEESRTLKPSGSASVAVVQPAIGRGGVNSWEVSDEDRIRMREHAAGSARAQSIGVPNKGYREGINGRTSPEFFMPYELFDHLLLALNSDGARAQRYHERYDPTLRTFGYDENKFWKTLSATAGPYLHTREEHQKHHQSTTAFRLPDGRTSFVTINRDDCAARIDALRATRRALGGAAFDRFLYTVVAATYQHSEGGSAPDRAEQLRYMAKGCK